MAQISAGTPPFILGQATARDTPRVASLLAAGLGADAELRVFVHGADHERRLKSYLHAETRALLAAGGAIDVANAGDRILAAAVWEQPDFRETMWQILRFGPTKLRAVRYRGVANWMTHRAQFMRLRPDAPHWHLVRLATDEAFRGQGIATALLEQRLKHIDRMGVPTHLESSSPESARLYERLGFQTVGEIRLPSDTCILAMTRAASPIARHP